MIAGLKIGFTFSSSNLNGTMGKLNATLGNDGFSTLISPLVTLAASIIIFNLRGSQATRERLRSEAREAQMYRR